VLMSDFFRIDISQSPSHLILDSGFPRFVPTYSANESPNLIRAVSQDSLHIKSRTYEQRAAAL
jgi:hypothetical protein